MEKNIDSIQFTYQCISIVKSARVHFVFMELLAFLGIHNCATAHAHSSLKRSMNET